MASLFDLEPARVADTSLEAYQRILPTLTEREIAVFLALCDYVEITRHKDATGGELAEWLDELTTQTRPRLTGLCKKGWIETTPARRSRVKRESRCHGYRPVVPRAAIERLNQ